MLFFILKNFLLGVMIGLALLHIVRSRVGICWPRLRRHAWSYGLHRLRFGRPTFVRRCATCKRFEFFGDQAAHTWVPVRAKDGLDYLHAAEWYS